MSDYDKTIRTIADYVCQTQTFSDRALDNARLVLWDSLACMMQALTFPACVKLLGPVVPLAQMKNGVRVPGTSYQLDPVQAAFNIGTAIRWLDYNDTWLAAEWGHPSDNLGGILAVADYVSYHRDLTVGTLLQYIIKAHEIQGVIALDNAFNRIGLDHVILVKLATTAVVTHLLGGDYEQVCAAISQVFVDGHSLRTYRHAPNTGSRKSWAAGDATSRGVWLALMSLRGEMGYPTALSAPNWGFNAVYLHDKPLVITHAYASEVIENILFKVAFPAEFHAQTAVECALQLHPLLKDRLDDIDKIMIYTQEPGIRIITKSGPLHNPADRDHCIQYMCAIALIFGQLSAEHYEDHIAKDPRIDAMRAKMIVEENPQFTQDYYDPNKRAISNAMQVFFNDGTTTDLVTVPYPIGHPRRRQEAKPLLRQKFQRSIELRFDNAHCQKILALYDNPEQFNNSQIADFMTMLCVSD